MFFGQKTFAVYTRVEDSNPLETAVFVKDGFSPMAAIFTFFWALYNRVWWLVGFCFFVQVGLQFLSEYGVIEEETRQIIIFCYHIFLGLQFQDWYEEDLQSRGYILIGIVMAKNLEEAQQRFFDKYIKHTTRKQQTTTNSLLAVSGA